MGRPRIIIETRELGEVWGTEREFLGMSDKAIIEIAKEDLFSLLEGAKFKVKRNR
jgi:hypothetical protein